MKKATIFLVSVLIIGCNSQSITPAPTSASGVKQQSVQLQVVPSGETTEQSNIKKKLIEDNKPGAIKHLYIISAYSGQTIIYSTVIGKVTSSGKRLTPLKVAAMEGQYVGREHTGISVRINNQKKKTSEVIQDDGTYGSSIPYLYWWDVQGRSHKHYVSGGQIIHISDQPLPVKNVIIQAEMTKEEA